MRIRPWALVLVLVLSGCVADVNPPDAPPESGLSSVTGDELPSAELSSQLRLVEPFDQIEIKGRDEVIIRVGEGQSVTLSGDLSEASKITTTVQDRTLKIDNVPNIDEGAEFNDAQAQVTVTIPRLTKLSVDGSADVEVNSSTGSPLTISLLGSGNLKGMGKSQQLMLISQGTGTADLSDLSVEDLTLDLSGSGDVRVTATNSLKASVSGNGSVEYTGKPNTIKKMITGSGTITSF